MHRMVTRAMGWGGLTVTYAAGLLAGLLLAHAAEAQDPDCAAKLKEEAAAALQGKLHEVRSELWRRMHAPVATQQPAEAEAPMPVVPAPSVPFRSIDEAIGWLKAKGQCEKATCNVRVAVTPHSSNGKPLSPGWTLYAYVSLTDVGLVRSYNITISRQRTFRLSARDPAATLTTLKESIFTFGHDGSLLEREGHLMVRTATEDALFAVTFKGAEYDPDDRENWDILLKQLGVGWNWGKSR
jgi:hypothetical protein